MGITLGTTTEHVCVEDGLYPDPLDCKKFYNCYGGKAHHVDCAEGTVFNPNIKSCDFPWNYNCESKQDSLYSNITNFKENIL